MLKEAVKRTLRLFGYRIGRMGNDDSLSPFEVQGQLIRRKSPMIFDIGANIGVVTQQYRSLFPSAIIHSFEPFTDSYLSLEHRFSRDGNIFPHKIAISENTNKHTLYSNRSAATNSLLLRDSRSDALWGQGLLDTNSLVEVESTTIDCFCTENHIHTIDILKMDIQGAEVRGLQGAEETLSRQAISLIYLEIILGETYIEQPKFLEYIQRLDSHGYDLFDLYNPVRRDMRLIQTDAIFINKDLKEVWRGGLMGRNAP
jgi:FkbM family methyltransferase